MDVGEYAKASGLAQAQQIVGGARAGSSPTLMGALNTLGDVNQLLADTAEQIERVAYHVDGGAPVPTGSGERKPASDSLTDALNERAEALRDPLYRIRNAMARVERRVGA